MHHLRKEFTVKPADKTPVSKRKFSLEQIKSHCALPILKRCFRGQDFTASDLKDEVSAFADYSYASVEKSDTVQNLEASFWMPGVLNQVLKLVPELVQGGLINCPAVNKLTEHARREANPAQMFLQERLCLEPGHKLIKSEVYRNYQDWCERNGHKPLSNLNFGREIARCFAKAIRAGDVNLNGKLTRNLLREQAYVGLDFFYDRIVDSENLPANAHGNSHKTATPEELEASMGVLEKMIQEEAEKVGEAK